MMNSVLTTLSLTIVLLPSSTRPNENNLQTLLRGLLQNDHPRSGSRQIKAGFLFMDNNASHPRQFRGVCPGQGFPLKTPISPKSPSTTGSTAVPVPLQTASSHRAHDPGPPRILQAEQQTRTSSCSPLPPFETSRLLLRDG